MSTEPPANAGKEVRVTDSQGVQVGSGNTQTNVGVDAGSLPPPQTVSAGVVVHNLPQASAVFVGRDLTVLADQLDGDDAGVVVGQAAVHGLGGIGKSELVNHYARRYLSRYSLVWWITADTVESLGLGLAALTRRLHPAATLADAQSWALGWLQANVGWLLVLDNVEDVNHITDLLGVVGGRGQVLVTTRRDLGAARWARAGLTPFRLGLLNRQASVELLTRLTGRHDDLDAAGVLAAELGDLPLALEQAAAYISQHDRMSFDDYRGLLSDQFDRVAGDAGQGGPVGRSVAAVWTVTMTAVARISPLGVRVMDVLAWLGPDGLPDDVLAPIADDPADVDDALAVLASYSMISRAAGLVGVHRLVQAVTRTTQQAAGTATAVQEQAIELLADAIPDDPINNVAGWPRWDTLLPHVDSLTSNLPADHQFALMLRVKDRAATYRQFQGQAHEAIAEFEKVLTDRRRLLGEDHPDTLASRHNLANAYQSVGRVDEAIAEYEQVLAHNRRVLGESHPSTLASRSNLANAYRSVGRVDEAFAEIQEVLADRRRLLGEDHPSTLTSRNNLAYTYQSAGRVNEALAEFEKALTDSQRVLGEDHPDTLTSRNNLAGAYLSAGRVDEAIAELEKVLTDSQRVLSDGHPSTLTSRNNLAYAYRSAGRLDEAIAEYEKVLTDSQRVLSDGHPSTLTSRNNLAYAYQKVGRIDEAIAEYERVLADSQRVLGPNHRITTVVARNLESLRRQAGE